MTNGPSAMKPELHKKAPPAPEIVQIAEELHAARAGAWQHFLALSLHDQRLVTIALVEAGAVVGGGGVIDRCRGVILHRQRHGEDAGEDHPRELDRDRLDGRMNGWATSRARMARAAARRRKRGAMGMFKP